MLTSSPTNTHYSTGPICVGLQDVYQPRPNHPLASLWVWSQADHQTGMQRDRSNNSAMTTQIPALDIPGAKIVVFDVIGSVNGRKYARQLAEFLHVLLCERLDQMRGRHCLKSLLHLCQLAFQFTRLQARQQINKSPYRRYSVKDKTSCLRSRFSTSRADQNAYIPQSFAARRSAA